MVDSERLQLLLRAAHAAAMPAAPEVRGGAVCRRKPRSKRVERLHALLTSFVADAFHEWAGGDGGGDAEARGAATAAELQQDGIAVELRQRQAELRMSEGRLAVRMQALRAAAERQVAEDVTGSSDGTAPATAHGPKDDAICAYVKQLVATIETEVAARRRVEERAELLCADAAHAAARRCHHCGETAAEAESPLLMCGDVASAHAKCGSPGSGGARVVDRSTGAGGPCSKNFCYDCLAKVYGQTATAVSSISFGPSRRCPYCRNECSCETCTRIERARRLRQLFLNPLVPAGEGSGVPRYVRPRAKSTLVLQPPPRKRQRRGGSRPALK